MSVPPLLLWSLVLVVSLAALIKGSDWFTGAAERLGRALGMPGFAVGATIVALGVVFVLLGAITDSLYAIGAGSAARWLRGSPRSLASERWISGSLYIGLGVAAALSSKQPRK